MKCGKARLTRSRRCGGWCATGGLEATSSGGRSPSGRTSSTSCAGRKRLIVELDGSQHQDRAAYDAHRTAWLASRGYKVLRLWNNEFLQDVPAAGDHILAEVEARGGRGVDRRWRRMGPLISIFSRRRGKRRTPLPTGEGWVRGPLEAAGGGVERGTP